MIAARFHAMNGSLARLGPLRAVVAAIALVLPTCLAGLPAARAGDPFVVARYPVSATARDAVTAKREALEHGQKRAFRALARRLLPVTAYRSLPAPSLEQIEETLDGFAVRNEQNSRTEYVAVLDFRFRADSVRALLASFGHSLVEEQAPRVALVPVVLAADASNGETAVTTVADARWPAAWSGLDLENALTPLGIVDVADRLAPSLMGQLLSGDAGALRVLQSELGAQEVVVVAVTPQPGGRQIQVSYAGHDHVGPFLLQRRLPVDDGDLGFAYEMAAVIGLGILEGRWKAIRATRAGLAAGTALASTSSDRISMFVRFNGMGEWIALQRELRAVPGLEGFDTGTVSARGAEIIADVAGGVASLEPSLRAIGLVVRNEAGMWIVSRN